MDLKVVCIFAKRRKKRGKLRAKCWSKHWLRISLYRTFIGLDCSMVEVNPLVVTTSGDVLALDAKFNFDDNALYRHPDVAAMRDTAEEDPREVEASKHGLNYIGLDGNIACLVNGA